jgi:hypothetical protein
MHDPIPIGLSVSRANDLLQIQNIQMRLPAEASGRFPKGSLHLAALSEGPHLPPHRHPG